MGFFVLFVYSVYLFHSHGESIRFIVHEKYEKKVKIGSSLGEGHVAARGKKRVSMGLTDRRKTAKNLADSRKN